MSYVDGFVIPVSDKNIGRYQEMAALAGNLWKKHGALHYMETVLEDGVQDEFGLPFSKAFSMVQPGETVVFSYIVYESREHRDAVNKKVMEDPEMKNMTAGGKYDDVFDCKRMAYSGFRTIVEM